MPASELAEAVARDRLERVEGEHAGAFLRERVQHRRRQCAPDVCATTVSFHERRAPVNVSATSVDLVIADAKQHEAPPSAGRSPN